MAFSVLIVDDEEDVRLALGSLVEEEVDGVHVTTAGDGPSALEILEDKSFDLILADYRMPGMDGLEFIEEAKRRHGRTPALLITAYPDPELAARAVSQVGVGLMIAKPMDLDYFVSVVRAVLANPTDAGHTARVFSP